MALEELIKQMTEIENLTIAMGSVLEKFLRTELEQRRKRQQQQQQRDYRLNSLELVCTILHFLVLFT